MKKIDITEAIRQKYKGYLPRFVFKAVEKLIHQDELNRMLDLQPHVGGIEFAHKIIDYLGITLHLHRPENLPAPDTGRYIFVSNHPLGGVDGIALAALLGDYFQGKIKIPVNDLLMNIEQMGDIFIPVNKYGSQGKHRYEAMEQALSSDSQIITFPAGLCSRMNDQGLIRDPRWSSSFIKMARKYDRQIVPILFDSRNSARFYRWARWRVKAGIKFGYELILLPDEMIRARGGTFDIYVAPPLSVADLPDQQADSESAQRIMEMVYDIPTNK